MDDPLKLVPLSLVRFVAWESNATKRPSPEIQGLWQAASAVDPDDPPPDPEEAGTDSIVIDPLSRSNRKMLDWPPPLEPEPDPEVVAPLVTRFPAVDSNATKRPSSLIVGCELSPFGAELLCPPVTAVVVPVARSVMKMLEVPVDPLLPDEDPDVEPDVLPEPDVVVTRLLAVDE